MSTTYKALIGEEDLALYGATSAVETFQRTTSTGGTVTMTKVGAGVVLTSFRPCSKPVKLYADDDPGTILHGWGDV